MGVSGWIDDPKSFNRYDQGTTNLFFTGVWERERANISEQQAFSGNYVHCGSSDCGASFYRSPGKRVCEKRKNKPIAVRCGNRNVRN